MFGDDLNSTVMTEQVGFGQVSDAREGVSALCGEAMRSSKRETKTPVGLEQSTKPRGDAATTSGCKF